MYHVAIGMPYFLTFWLASMAIAADHRVLLDAHNCYPYGGRFEDRIDRALATGIPVAIEQDLAWHVDHSVLSHEVKTTGTEPLMKDYFFEKIRPIIEKELKEGDKNRWPIIVLNLDFKTNEPEHHRAVWKLLKEYEPWLTTAVRKKDPFKASKLDVKPLLVLTGNPASQEAVFHGEVPVGAKLLLFGAVLVKPGEMPGKATNYRRWWNNPWSVVEEEGQVKAGEWTEDDEKRLKKLVDHAHSRKLWIRFYTLNGISAPGLTESYNFGSPTAVQVRWKACIRTGVDFVATDQYQEFSDFAMAEKRQ
jgi:hypothetical protein